VLEKIPKNRRIVERGGSLIALNDLGRQQERIKGEITRSIESVLNHGKYVMGPEITQLEQQLAEYAGVQSVITCSSGTDAIVMTLMAWNIGPGDAVFTPSFTFVAAAEAVALLGATPVFVDIDKDTFLLDSGSLEKAVIKVAREGKLQPKVVIPADLFGLMADYDEIEAVARRYSLHVLEDASQSLGARHHDTRAGGVGHAAVTSFFPTKALGCYGDGGAVFTNDTELAEKLKSIRVHGSGEDKYDNVRIGLNARLDTIQAAILLVKLKILSEEAVSRKGIAQKYTASLSCCIQPQLIPSCCISNYSIYSVLARNSHHRQNIRSRLWEKGVQTAIYYPKPLHLQAAFSNHRHLASDLPVSEDICSRIFSLPMHPYLGEDEINSVIRGLAASYTGDNG